MLGEPILLDPPRGGKNRKNDPEILLGRSWPRPKFCFWPPVAAKSALGAILRALKTGFGADFGFEAFLDQFWRRFGSIFDRRNLIIHWQGQSILHFSDLSKKCEKGAPGTPGGAKNGP